MASAALYIDRCRAAEAEVAQSCAFLIGDYAGCPNFAHYLQLKATLEYHNQVGARQILYVLLNLNGTAAHWQDLISVGANGNVVVPIYYYPASTPPRSNDLLDLVPLPHVPSRTLVHFYGGGFVNDAQSHFVRQVVSAFMDCHSRDNINGDLRLFVSGMQISTSTEANAWRHLLARAEYIGARDAMTMTLVTRLLNGDAGKVCYSGDDGLLTLAAALKGRAPGGSASTLAVHINCVDYSPIDADRLIERVGRVIAVGARRLGDGATCDLLFDCPADYMAEREVIQKLESCYRRLAEVGVGPKLAFRPRNLFNEAVDGNLHFRASFLVAHSYHVALMGLLAHCPTLLILENDCCRQIAIDLADVFPGHRFGAVGRDDDAISAAEAVLEGQPPGNGSYTMWTGQADKALRLACVYADMERAAARNRLELTASAFREVAANLGELRRRRILEERLAKEVAQQTAVTITIPATTALTRYLAASYWGRRRAVWVKSIKKRVNKWS